MISFFGDAGFASITIANRQKINVTNTNSRPLTLVFDKDSRILGKELMASPCCLLVLMQLEGMEEIEVKECGRTPSQRHQRLPSLATHPKCAFPLPLLGTVGIGSYPLCSRTNNSDKLDWRRWS